ncbi:MAG: M48 family metallopeptidase [Rikenellaceae bacterium]|nr:M48 family metallopeptidase [Rikenellaceae bacterium]
MQYVGIQTQKTRNNLRSLLLLVLFPILVAALSWVFCYLLVWLGTDTEHYGTSSILPTTNYLFIDSLPIVLGGVLLWFVIAYFINTSIINNAVHSKPLDRRENKRVYNLVENLCIAKGMAMPMVNVIEDQSLNAFASGINKKTYTVTLTRGIIDRLDDDELEGVIAHELSHIRNNDVRLLIVSIVFVGIFTMISQIALRSVMYGRFSNRGKNGGGVIVLLLLVAILAAIGYFFATMMRFAISRKREYLADAGAAEMTKNPLALASALRKISGNPDVESISREDVAQLFIQHPLKSDKKKGFSSLFATHPPIDRRIEVLERF